MTSVQHVLLLSGWGRPPSDGYQRILEPVERAFDVVVHAPFLYGNHRLANPPIGLSQSVEQTVAWIAHALQPEEPYLVCGHSTGALVGLLLACTQKPPVGVFAMSPLQGTPYGWPGFVARSLRMNARHLLGTSGAPSRSRSLALRTGAAYTFNALRKPSALVHCLRDFTAIDPMQLLRACERPRATPIEVVVGARDDFFDVPDSLEDDLALAFTRPRVLRLPEMKSHEWCLLQPEVAAEHLIRFIEGELGWEGRKRAGQA